MWRYLVQRATQGAEWAINRKRKGDKQLQRKEQHQIAIAKRFTGVAKEASTWEDQSTSQAG